MSHTPTPWRLIGKQGTAIWSGDNIVAQINAPREGHSRARTDAEFIVHACNAHDELVAAAKGCLDAGSTGTILAALDRLQKAVEKAEAK